MNAAATVLVTGARGFIGAHVVAALRRSDFDVRAGVRAPASDTQFACDLNTPAQVRAAVAGARLVVHTAYGDSAAMAQQCRHLLNAMRQEGVDSLIHLSSIAVYGEAAGLIDETIPPCGRLDAYAAAKIECEDLIGEWAAEPAYPARRALILRPGIVYGAGSRFWIDKLAERIRCGAWGTFGANGEGHAALLHVDDLTALIETAARRLTEESCAAWPKAQALNVVGPETPSWNAYFAALAETLGAPALPVLDGVRLAARQTLSLPAKAWRRLGLPGGEVAALAPTAGEIALFARQAFYSTAALRNLLDIAPGIGMREGLARSLTQEKA